MKYIVRKPVIHPTPELEISVQEYLILKEARKILANAFSIEEKYEVVISNFVEFEKEMLSISNFYMLRQALDYSGIFDTLSILNIRLVNLLTAVKLYQDSILRHARNSDPENVNIEDLVKAKRSSEYDANFEYRFMEALRNHVQHQGLPIHFLNPLRSIPFENDGTVDIQAYRTYFEEDDTFKKKTLAEIPDKIDLKESTRSYIESISSINEFVRESISNSVNSARMMIESVHKRYSQLSTDNLIGLTAFEIKDDKEISSVLLMLEWDDLRIKLQKRNAQIMNLKKRYVTGKIIDKPA